MEKISEKLGFRRRMLAVTAITLAIMHFVYIGSMLLYTLLAKTAPADAWYMVAAEFCLTLFALVLKYFLFGSIVTVFDSYQTSQSMPFIGVTVVSLIISRVGEIIIYPLTHTQVTLTESQQLVYSVGTELLTDIIVVFVILFISRSCNPKKLSRFTFMSLIICAVPTVYTIAERAFLYVIPTISEISQSIEPVTPTEIMWMIYDPIILPIISGFAGLLIMIASNDKFLAMSKKYTKRK